MISLKQFTKNWQYKLDMAKQQVEQPVSDGHVNRFVVVFLDNETKVQVAAATEDLDKFTKTDLMKMVKAFKDGVKQEEKFNYEKLKLAEEELNDESHQRGNRKTSRRVRRSRKVSKP